MHYSSIHNGKNSSEKKMKKHLLILAILLSFVLPSAALAKETNVTITAAERKMAETITAKQLSDYLHFVASDAMGGRDTPSQGLDITAEFLAYNLKKWGFKPAGDDGTFFQKMMLSGSAIDSSKVKLNINGKDLKYSDDYFLLGGSGVGNGSLVFAKGGWMVKSKGLNDFEGIDVKDKIIVITGEGFNGRGVQPPKGISKDDLKGVKGTDWADPITYANKNGAKGVVVLATGRIAQFWSQLGSFLGRGRMTVEGLGGTPRGGTKEETVPLLLVSSKVTSEIFAGESADSKSAKAFDLNKTMNFAAANSKKRVSTQNVVAIWEGSHPKLKEEMVAVGAHYDHVGTRPNAKGEDKIWNGADDDGSGTVAVLAIAEALAKAKKRPKRSILFVWHAGEEKGLWGSEYFNKYPTVNIKNVVAQLNLDMIGRSKSIGDVNPKNAELSGPNEVYVIGADMMSSTLGAVTKQTNKSYSNMTYNYKYDDPQDKNRFFFRSDHFNYAVNGIPVAFWFDGVHVDYHGAGDHPDKIDYKKMEKITRTIFLTMWEISELKNRPIVDKKLPPELTRRG
jgi:hypothetical protein